MADSDAIYDLSFNQSGDLVLNDTAVYAAIVELLLELEGVDPEPHFWARSNRGPWHIAHRTSQSSKTVRNNSRRNTESKLTFASKAQA